MGMIKDLSAELTISETLAAAARTASGNGAAVDLQGYVGKIMVVLDSALGTGTTPTLDVKLQDCDTSGGTYADISGATFTQVTGAAGAGAQKMGVDVRGVRRFIRAVATIAGSTPSFACAVLVAGQKQVI